MCLVKTVVKDLQGFVLSDNELQAKDVMRHAVKLSAFCLIIFSGSIFSQPTGLKDVLDYRIIFADSLKNNASASKEIARLKNELSFPAQVHHERGLVYYNLAICYAAENQPDSSCYYLLKALDITPRYNNLIYTDTDFELLYENPCWNTIQQRIDSAYLSDNPEITHKELALELYHIYLSDQHARGLWLKKANMNILSADSIKLERVESIIKQYGWPTFSMIGQTAANGAFLVVQHSDVKTQVKYSNQILIAAREGEANKEWVALILDRIAVQLKGYQFFGTQVYQIRDSLTGQPGPWQYFPIYDESIVDSVRAEMGMVPLEEYLKLFGINYQPGN